MNSQPPSRRRYTLLARYLSRQREAIEGITALALASRIAGAGKASVAFAPSFRTLFSSVAALAQPGDMILTLGAGSVSQLGAMIVEKLDGANQLGTVSNRENKL